MNESLILGGGLIALGTVCIICGAIESRGAIKERVYEWLFNLGTALCKLKFEHERKKYKHYF